MNGDGKDNAMSFGHDTTTDEVLAGIDLSGKRALVTGASGGLGAETARALASRGAAVTLTARNMAKGEAQAALIRETTGNQEIDLLEMELASLDSVRTAAKTWLSRYDQLNILVNNAGIMACPLERTGDGWESQFATNHLGHFVFACHLVPALRAGAPARIVILSSGAHRFGSVDFDDLQFENREYDKFVAYGQSKTANIWFALELNRRLADAGVTANAVHPGVIMTDLGRHLTPEDLAAFPGDTAPDAMRFKTVEAGAATSVWAATSAELEGRGGLYLEDCQVGQPGNVDSPGGYSPWAFDAEGAKTLWRVSEDLVGERFDVG